MAERLAVTKGTQIGVETTSGTAVPADKALQMLMIDLTVETETKSFRGNGRQFANTVRINKDSTSGKWDMKDADGTPAASYSELVYPLSSVFGAATITTPVGATNARQWEWDVALTGPTTAKTFSVEQGDAVRAHKVAYGLFTGVNIKADREGVEASGNFIAQKLTDNATLTSTPTLLPITPILGNQWTLYRDTTSAGLGTTALTRVYNVEVDTGDIYNPHWPGNRSNTSFATHTQVAPKPTLKITMQADTAGMGGLTDIRAGTIEYFRFECIGPEVESGQNQSLIIDMACMYRDPIPFKDGEDVLEVEYMLDIVEDTTWTHAMIIDLVNALTAL